MSDEVNDLTPEAETASDEQKPTETVDFWKQKAREQEKRAKDNAAAAKRLAELEDAQKSEAEKAADRIAQAEAETASIPSKVTEALLQHLDALHSFTDEERPMLTAPDPETLLKQVDYLVRNRENKTNHVPREGRSPKPTNNSDAAFVRELFG